MSGQGAAAGKSKVKEGEKYAQLDSLHVPGEPEEDGGVDEPGQKQSEIKVRSSPPADRKASHQMKVEQGVELQGAVATGGRKKKRKSLKHAIQKKIIPRITGRGRRVSSSSSESGIQIHETMEDPDTQTVAEEDEDIQGMLEDELECHSELEEELKIEWEKQVGEMEAEWTAKMDRLKSQLEGEVMSLREERDRALGRSEEAERMKTLAESELEQAKKNNAIVLKKKARELEEKDATIKSLQVNVKKMEQLEESVADLRKKNLEIKDSLRHKEGVERLQQEKINDLEKEVEDQKQHIEEYKKVIDKHKADIEAHQEDIEAKEKQHQAELKQAREELTNQHEAEVNHLRAELKAKQQHQVELEQAREEIDKLKKANELRVDYDQKAELEAKERYQAELEQAREEIGQLKNQHEAEVHPLRAKLEAMKEQHQIELNQVRGEIMEQHRAELERVHDAMQQAELKVKMPEQDGEKVKGELKALQEVNSELRKHTKFTEGEAKEKKDELDQGSTHENELRSLQHELELVRSELKEEKAKVSELQSKLKASGEVVKPSLAEAEAVTSERNQHSGISVPQGKTSLVPRHNEKAKLIAHDSSSAQEHYGDDNGDDKTYSPHTSMGEGKSPFSSLGEVKVEVVEDNMTDTDKLELQQMLKESHEALDRLWNQNKMLLEQLKSRDAPKLSISEEGGASDTTQHEVVQLTKRLRAFEQHLCYPSDQDYHERSLPQSSDQDQQTAGALQRLKNKYLSLHSEKIELQSENKELHDKVEELQAQLAIRLNSLCQEERDSQLKELQEKVEERDAQLKKLREEKLTVDADYPVTERSLSFEGPGSPLHWKAEAERLKAVVMDREKKIDNLTVQLNSFQKVLASNAEMEAQISNLLFKLKASEEEVQRLKVSSDAGSDVAQMNELLHEEVSSVRKQLGTLEREKLAEEKAQEELTCELRDKNLQLQNEVTRLQSALTFLQSKHSEEETAASDKELDEQLNKIMITDLQNKISRKDAAIQNLTDSRRTLESRMARLGEERDRYAEQVSELLKVKANLKGELDRYGVFQGELKEHAVQLKQEIAAKLCEANGLKEEREMMTQEIKDLQNELEARRLEVDLVKEDFEKEREERASMASRFDIDHGKWRVREQELEDEIEYRKNLLQEKIQRMNTIELQHQEEKKHLDSKIKFLTNESEQREFQLTTKLEDQTAKAVKLQKEMDEQCDRLREERDVMKMEWNRVSEMYDEQKIKHREALDELLADKQHMEAHMTNLNETITMLQAQRQSLEDCIRTLEDEKLKNEKIHETTAAMKRELENQLHDVTRQFGQEREHLVSKLNALDQQRKHDYAQWMIDRQQLEGAIADIARLSDESINLEQQLKHSKAQAESYKVKFQEEKARLTQLLKERDDAHKDELEVLRAQWESEKMDQAIELNRLRRELESSGGKRSPSNRDARELETLRKKHDAVLDGFTEARDLLIRHNIPFRMQGYEVHETSTTQPNPDYNVRPYPGTPSQTPSSLDAGDSSSSTAPAGFHRLGDINSRGQAFSTSLQPKAAEDNLHPQGGFPSENSRGYGHTPQQNLVPQNVQQQKMQDYNKSGYGEKSNYRPVEQNYQTPVQRASPTYNQQTGGGGIRAHAHGQQSHAPMSNLPVDQHYQQQLSPRLPAPQHQSAPRTQYTPSHGYAPQPESQQPPTNPHAGARPPNPSIVQENLLLKNIDSDISQAAADIQREVEPGSMPAREDSWPLDSNLICPMCKTQFRIGQIQLYKKHVDKCEGE